MSSRCGLCPCLFLTNYEQKINNLLVYLHFLITQGQTVNGLKTAILENNYFVPDYLSVSCVDLIRSILKRDPAERITMAGIRSCEWLHGQIKLSPLATQHFVPSEPEEVSSLFSIQVIVEDNTFVFERKSEEPNGKKCYRPVRWTRHHGIDDYGPSWQRRTKCCHRHLPDIDVPRLLRRGDRYFEQWKGNRREGAEGTPSGTSDLAVERLVHQFDQIQPVDSVEKIGIELDEATCANTATQCQTRTINATAGVTEQTEIKGEINFDALAGQKRWTAHLKRQEIQQEEKSFSGMYYLVIASSSRPFLYVLLCNVFIAIVLFSMTR